MPPLTRGPLPARVYWVRRVMVLGTALLLVFGIGRLLGNGSDASSEQDQAAPVAADSAPSTTLSESGSSSAGSNPGKGRKKQTKAPEPTPTLAAPDGECDGSDIAVTPEVTDAVAGRDVMVVLQLRTIESEACTWRVGPGALAVNITSGSDGIWSSRECPRAIPRRDLVIRKAVTTKVGIIWDEARRSNEGCTKLAGWAYPGWYHVAAAALGGEPSDVQFELGTPAAATITRTASPTNSPSQTPTGRPVTSQGPSGAVEPDGR